MFDLTIYESADDLYEIYSYRKMFPTDMQLTIERYLNPTLGEEFKKRYDLMQSLDDDKKVSHTVDINIMSDKASEAHSLIDSLFINKEDKLLKQYHAIINFCKNYKVEDAFDIVSILSSTNKSLNNMENGDYRNNISGPRAIVVIDFLVLYCLPYYIHGIKIADKINKYNNIPTVIDMNYIYNGHDVNTDDIYDSFINHLIDSSATVSAAWLKKFLIDFLHVDDKDDISNIVNLFEFFNNMHYESLGNGYSNLFYKMLDDNISPDEIDIKGIKSDYDSVNHIKNFASLEPAPIVVGGTEYARFGDDLLEGTELNWKGLIDFVEKILNTEKVNYKLSEDNLGYLLTCKETGKLKLAMVVPNIKETFYLLKDTESRLIYLLWEKDGNIYGRSVFDTIYNTFNRLHGIIIESKEDLVTYNYKE